MCLVHRLFPSVSQDRVAQRAIVVGAAPLAVVVAVAVEVVVGALTDKHSSNTTTKISPKKEVEVALVAVWEVVEEE